MANYIRTAKRNSELFFVGLNFMWTQIIKRVNRPAFKYLSLYLIAIILFSVPYYLFSELLRYDLGDLDYFTCLYFSAVTITTLGYGEIVPVTHSGKALVICQSISGIIIIGLYLQAIARHRDEEDAHARACVGYYALRRALSPHMVHLAWMYLGAAAKAPGSSGSPNSFGISISDFAGELQHLDFSKESRHLGTSRRDINLSWIGFLPSEIDSLERSLRDVLNFHSSYMDTEIVTLTDELLRSRLMEVMHMTFVKRPSNLKTIGYPAPLFSSLKDGIIEYLICLDKIIKRLRVVTDGSVDIGRTSFPDDYEYGECRADVPSVS